MAPKTLDFTVVPDRSLFALQMQKCSIVSPFSETGKMPLKNNAGSFRDKDESLSSDACSAKAAKRIATAFIVVMSAILIGCSAKDPAKEAPLRSDVQARMDSYYASNSIELAVDIGHTGTQCFFPFSGERNEEPMDIGYTPDKDVPTVTAVRAGLISVNPAGKNRWDVSLTEKGKAFFENEHGVRQFHRAGHGCDEYQVTFPIARAFVVDVSSPKIQEEQPGSFIYEYTASSKWRITDLGNALQSDGEVYNQLTAEQRQELEKSINPPDDIYHGPRFALPAPHENENVPHSVTATFKKENGSMVLDKVRNL